MMSTAARRHTISNTTQPMDAAMAMVEEEEDMEGEISGSGVVVVCGGEGVVVSGGGAMVSGGRGVVVSVGGIVTMVSGEQAEPSP